MRKVVDSNYLRNPELRAYLSASKQNIAVLTDYAAMEAYKGDTLVNIYSSMAILAEFPAQVLVLKNTLLACGLSGRSTGLQKRLIDDEQTKGFSVYCGNLAAARAGDVHVQRQLLDLGHEATQHLEERVLTDARTLPAVIADLAAGYSKEQLAALRTAKPYSDAVVKKLIESVLHIAIGMFRAHPRVQELPQRKEMPNTFIFRAALCAYFLALDWIAISGAQGAQGASAKRIRNDMVDVNFATYATYFDGLLSSDGKTHRIHDQARLFLAIVFGCHISGVTQ